jgi:hypothetical protein
VTARRSKRPASKKRTKRSVEAKPALKRRVRKPVAKKPVAKKPVAKKPVAKKPVVKKPVAKKSVAKKPVVKKPVGKKPVAKKPARRPIVLPPKRREARREETSLRVRIAKLLKRGQWTFAGLAKVLGITEARAKKLLGKAPGKKAVKPKIVRKPRPERRPALPKPLSRKDEDDRASVIRKGLKGDLVKWSKGQQRLDSERSHGESVHFSVRRRLTNKLVMAVMEKVHAITHRLSEHPYPYWMAYYSLMVVGKQHPRLPGYQPLKVVGLGKQEGAYVSYESTGLHRTEEDMRAHLASSLYALVTSETYVSLEQMSVSVLRMKGPEERTNWFRANRTRSRRFRRQKG